MKLIIYRQPYIAAAAPKYITDCEIDSHLNRVVETLKRFDIDAEVSDIDTTKMLEVSVRYDEQINLGETLHYEVNDAIDFARILLAQLKPCTKDFMQYTEVKINLDTTRNTKA